jgi:phosphoribosylglycinamide formyltransferase-1
MSVPIADSKTAKLRLGVFVSGSGSNLQAILDACRSSGYPAEVVVVVSNAASAYGLVRAQQAGIPTMVVPHRDFRTRPKHEKEIIRRISSYRVELCVLAGYMRVVTPLLLGHFYNQRFSLPGVINIHPADTRVYQGTHGYEFALGLIPGSSRLIQTKITVHFVDQGVDTGPIIAQKSLEVLAGDGIDELRKRGLEIEHELYPEVIRWYAQGRLQLDAQGQVMLRDLKRQGDI